MRQQSFVTLKKKTLSAESKNEVAYSLSRFLHFVKNSVEQDIAGSMQQLELGS